MKVFVINLKKNAERMSKISMRLQELDIPFERIEAIYGKELSDSEKKAKVNYFRWWCTRGYKIRDGEIGCTSSHNLIYAQMLRGKIPFACILEDDAILSDMFPKQLKNVEKFLQGKSDEKIVVQLANHSGTNAQDWEIAPIHNSSYSEAYAINLAGAKSYLAVNSPMCTPVDMWGYWQRKGIFKLYQAYPGVCEQDWSKGFVSDVCPTGSFATANLPLHRWTLWKVKRMLGIAIDRLFF